MRSQNLIPDSSFENSNYCQLFNDTDYSIQESFVERGMLPEWDSWGGTSYFNKCHPYYYQNKGTKQEAEYLLYRNAHSGDGYISFFYKYSEYSPTYNFSLEGSCGQEMIYCKLKAPLEKGKKYRIEIYGRLDSSSTVCKNEFRFDFCDSIPLKPHYLFISTQVLNKIDSTNGRAIFVDNTSDWTKISAEYIAHGGENYFILGGGRYPASEVTKPTSKRRYLAYEKSVIYGFYNKNEAPSEAQKAYDESAKQFRYDRRAVYDFDDVSVEEIK